ncbi:Uncharacterized protein FWK35_00011840 [Aphis craccivora]|uniref:Uncharacterized protein n=1 Tax=Aphis craccivora TaxID=307492 RepID=A0A6G0Z9Y1_APHCR|nr:Uncharacterized protein FWK35_00011840 [Aphis craccivora]
MSVCVFILYEANKKKCAQISLGFFNGKIYHRKEKHSCESTLPARNIKKTARSTDVQFIMRNVYNIYTHYTRLQLTAAAAVVVVVVVVMISRTRKPMLYV